MLKQIHMLTTQWIQLEKSNSFGENIPFHHFPILKSLSEERDGMDGGPLTNKERTVGFHSPAQKFTDSLTP